jgi:hypothetical protein
MPTYALLTVQVVPTRKLVNRMCTTPTHLQHYTRDYVYEYDTSAFEARVQDAIKKGATLVGGLSVTELPGMSVLIYTQAVLFPQ